MLRAVANPPNPWQSTSLEYLDEIPSARLEIFEDHSTSILSRNDEARVGFALSVNPYRGCQHACAYCEARRWHELLGFGAGTDFDSKIVIKPRAAELLRDAFEAKSWRGDVVVFSGATDCYQPIEASYRLTRACLEVCAAYRNPVAIITKGALVERDRDLLVRLHEEARATISVSIPIWNETIARAVEPMVPTPARRMRTIAKLAEAGLDVGISVSPMIPGLGEDALNELLTAAADAGARRATMDFLRVRGSVEDVFAERLRNDVPLRAERVLARVGATREGRPEATMQARLLEALFAKTCARVGLSFAKAGDDRANTPSAGPIGTRTFRRPARAGDQLGLFGPR